MTAKEDRPDEAAAPRYAGFISYSQKDKAWAMRIHRALERYRLPVGLPEGPRPGRKLGRFFRDDDELAGAPSLGAALEGAIAESAALIVICSPNSARSKWVDAEIRKFKSRGREARVFAVIVAGRPDAEAPEERCFPPSLLRRVDANGNLTAEADEPLAPNAAKDSFPRLVARLAAGLVGIDFDTLWQREKRRRSRRRILAGAAACVAAIAAAAGVYMVREAEMRQLAEQSARLAGQAQAAMDAGRRSDAIAFLDAALPASLENPERPVVPEALAALRRAMADSTALGSLAQFEEPVTALRPTPAGRLAVFLASGAIRVIEQDTGKPHASHLPDTRLQPLHASGMLFTARNAERQKDDGTWANDVSASVIDPDTGEVSRNVELNASKWFGHWVLSPRGTRAFVTSYHTEPGDQTTLGVVDLTRGDDVGEVTATTTTLIDKDLHVSPGFGDDDTLFLSWGHGRKALAVWQIGEGPVTSLVSADGTAACPDAGAADPERQDSVTLSPDRMHISHARPLGDGDWCVQVWDATTAEPLEAHLLRKAYPAGIVPIAHDLWALPKFWRDWQSQAELRTPSGMARVVEGCGQTLVDSLTLHARIDGWVIDADAKISACATGDTITVHDGAAFQPVGDFAGHEGKVQALWLDGTARALWSGGEDGTVRRWSVPRAPAFAPELIPVSPPVVSDDGTTIAAIFRTEDDGFFVKVFTADGNALSPRIRFALAPVPDGQQEVNRNVAPVLLDDGRTVGIAQAFDCGFPGCPETFRNRLELWRTNNGEAVLRVDGVARAGPDRMQPLRLLARPGMAVLSLQDGAVRVIDAETGNVHGAFTLPEGAWILDMAFAHDALWLVQTDSPESPETRQVSLLRLPIQDLDTAAAYAPDLVDRRRAQGAALFPAPDGGALMIGHDYAHRSSAPFELSVVGPDGKLLQAGDLPADVHSVSHVSFPGGGTRSATHAVVFHDRDVPPRILTLATGEFTNFTTETPGSTWESRRADDPLRRAFVSTSQERLTLLSYGQGEGEQEKLCPSLHRSRAEAAAFSRDGARLAVADQNSVRIFDLSTCALQREVAAHTTGLRPLAFAADGTLWIRQRDAHFRLVRPPPPDVALLRALRRTSKK